jgi:hypothetical protein
MPMDMRAIDIGNAAANPPGHAQGLRAVCVVSRCAR